MQQCGDSVSIDRKYTVYISYHNPKSNLPAAKISIDAKNVVLLESAFAGCRLFELELHNVTVIERFAFSQSNITKLVAQFKLQSNNSVKIAEDAFVEAGIDVLKLRCERFVRSANVTSPALFSHRPNLCHIAAKTHIIIEGNECIDIFERYCGTMCNAPCYVCDFREIRFFNAHPTYISINKYVTFFRKRRENRLVKIFQISHEVRDFTQPLSKRYLKNVTLLLIVTHYFSFIYYANAGISR